jgi:hypothetical protein
MTYFKIIRDNVTAGLMTYSEALDWLQGYGVKASFAITALQGLDNE